MKKATATAIKNIYNGKTLNERKGFIFQDKDTGDYGVTDYFCLVKFHNADVDELTAAVEDLCVSKANDDDVDVKKLAMSSLFDPFINRFHEFYSDDRYASVATKDIVQMVKNKKKESKENPDWYMVDCLGLTFDMRLMRLVCEAMDAKEVGIYYPYSVYGNDNVNTFKPIVILAKDNGNMGLVMQIRK